ncbi:vascular endothelial growth factor receptor [Anopheles sinensis]|uniref:Receptor protein-tyrosine kinase n=1 Tax=Anopheles sinensis TaxID=74873 RepID=A0A084W1Y9_ANOSI|nr:vascular endothelial growth factor receptor [Anopheles sinensis]
MSTQQTTSPSDTVNFHVKASFELPPSPGIVRCTATNIQGTESTKSLLFLRNFEPNILLEVTSSIGPIYDSERVDIRCRLDRYEFTNEITLNYDGYHKKFLDIEAESENRYYWEAIHTLPGTLNSSKDIVVQCHGVLRNGTSMSEKLNITVRHPIAPSIATIDGRNSRTVPIKRGETLPLFCNVSGDPAPVISWSKNLTDLHNNSSSISVTLFPNESLSYFRCEAQNRFGNTSYTWEVIEQRRDADREPIWKTALPALFLILVVVSVCFIQPRIREKSHTVSHPSKTDPDETGGIVPPEFEFPRNQLALGKKIGQGQFGVVMLATANNIIANEAVTKVAVKMVRSTANKNDAHEALLSELATLVSIGQHLNVVNLLGAVTKHVGKAGTMIIFEYCPYGCLEQYLRKNASKFIDCQDDLEQTWQYFLKQEHADPKDDGKRACIEFRTTDLICWAAQVANGMAYLADRNVVHGDLAARNVLLCYDNVVKIGDFGLAHIVEVPGQSFKRTNDRPLPVKWLALESLIEHVFSTKSDVWAYGVMLWEFFSLGATPYPDISANECFLSRIRDGYRMEKPKYASEEIFDHMITCWYVNPQRRPSFQELASSFNSMLPVELQNHYITMNGAYLEPYKLLKAANDAYVIALGAPSQPATQCGPSAFFSPTADSLATTIPMPFQTFTQTQPHGQPGNDSEEVKLI